MKVIDQTPYFRADGKINVIDQAKATMKMGATWVQETQAQPGVVAALERGLDKRFTLLRNVTLSGLEISIPMILVGPTGIFVFYVTALRGMYRAKGDLWGTLSGEKFTPSSVNLLTRANRMARAVQVYLQKQGFENIGAVEDAILCADPGMHVDSVRPIVRVVQSDALERFAGSIAQGRPLYSQETVAELANRIVKPRQARTEEAAPTAVKPAADGSASFQKELREEEAYVPAFTLPETESEFASQPAETGRLGFEFHDAEETPEEEPERPYLSVPDGKVQKPNQLKKRPRKGFSTRQWIVLILFAMVECVLVIVLSYLVLQNP